MRKFNIIQIAYPTKEDFLSKNLDSIRFFDRGYVELEDNQDHDDVWNICNYRCYQNTKPEKHHSSLGICNSDIVTWEEYSKEYWVAESVGWKKFDNLDDAKEYMMQDKEFRSWPFRVYA